MNEIQNLKQNLFWSLDIGFWNLFGILDLEFGI